MSTTVREAAAVEAHPGRRASRVWPILYAIYIGVLGLLFLRHNIDYGLDDSFISYRYAQNFSDGYGLAFNPGERFYGTTAAGYATLLGVIHMVTGLAIPKVSVGLAALGVTAVAACLPTLAGRVPGVRRWVLSAVFATAAFALGPFSQVAGHETVVYLSVALVATMCITHWARPATGGLLIAAAVTFRPDVALLAGLLAAGLWFVDGGSLRAFLRSSALRRYLLALVLPLLAWLGFLYAQFGAVVPGTLDAKRAQVRLGHWPLYDPEQLRLYLLGFLGTAGLALLVVGLVGIAVKPQRSTVALVGAWLGFALGAAAVYSVTGVTFWFWYATPLFFALLVCSFVGWAGLAARRWGWLPVAALVGVLIWQMPAIRVSMATPNLKPHIHAYEQVADHIAAASPDGASILMPEPGSFGFHLGPEYTVVDELGLVSPGVATALLEDDTSWAFRTYRPDYLICSWHGRYTSCDQGLHKRGYSLVGEFDAWFWQPYVGRGNRLYVRDDLETTGGRGTTP